MTIGVVVAKWVFELAMCARLVVLVAVVSVVSAQFAKLAIGDSAILDIGVDMANAVRVVRIDTDNAVIGFDLDCTAFVANSGEASYLVVRTVDYIFDNSATDHMDNVADSSYLVDVGHIVVGCTTILSNLKMEFYISPCSVGIVVYIIELVGCLIGNRTISGTLEASVI
jgi:hypothetical protein